MDRVRFHSRVDAWIAGVAFGPVVVATWLLAAEYRATAAPAIAFAVVLCVVVLAFLLWLFLDTSYTVTAVDLIVRSGPVRARIPLHRIHTVRRSSTLLSGPALSLRRLEIEHGEFETAIVSPADIEGFVAELIKRNPAIRTES